MCVLLLQIFSFNQKPAGDEEDADDDADLSDSSDSVYSGLEDSGSDSDDVPEEEERGPEEEDEEAEPELGEQVGPSLPLCCGEGLTGSPQQRSCSTLPTGRGRRGRTTQRRRGKE